MENVRRGDYAHRPQKSPAGNRIPIYHGRWANRPCINPHPHRRMPHIRRGDYAHRPPSIPAGDRIPIYPGRWANRPGNNPRAHRRMPHIRRGDYTHRPPSIPAGHRIPINPGRWANRPRINPRAHPLHPATIARARHVLALSHHPRATGGGIAVRHAVHDKAAAMLRLNDVPK